MAEQKSKKAKRKLPAADDEQNEITTLQDAVTYFTSCLTSVTSVRFHGSVSTKKALEVLENAAVDHGLSADHIAELIDVCAWEKFPKTVRSRVVKCLIPADVVPVRAIVKLVSWLCCSAMSTDTKVLLVRWLLVIFDDLETESFKTLQDYYSLLFLMLHNSQMCRFLCHLLYRLTLKRHVRPYCVESLLRLQKSTVKYQSELQGLLSLYKHFQPHLVAVSASVTVKVFSRLTDNAWRARVRQVTNRRGPLLSCQPVTPQDRLEFAQPLKRQKMDAIPRCSVMMPVTGGDGVVAVKQPKLVPYSQIKNFSQLTKCINTIELPCQIASVLDDSNLQYVVMCSTDPTTSLRLEYWLQQKLSEEFLNCSGANYERQQRLLTSIVTFSEFLQEGVPVCDEFLASYLLTWNGFTNRELILKLLSRLRLRPFTELYQSILEPLRKLFFVSSHFFKCRVLQCWTELLRNWAQVEFHRHQRNVALGRLTATDDDITPCDKPYDGVFAVGSESLNAIDSLTSFVEFVDRVCCVALRQHNFDILLTHFVLQFFNEVSVLYSHHRVPVFLVPSRGIVYSSLFHRSAVAISTICIILHQCRTSWQLLRQNKSTDVAVKQLIDRAALKQCIAKINAYTVDIFDALWRLYAFTDRQSSTELSQLRLLQRPSVDRLKLPNANLLASLYMHRGLLGFADKFLSATQPAGSSAQPANIKKYRTPYLEFLSQNHVDGIVEFLSSSVHRGSSQRSSSAADTECAAINT